MFLGPLDEGVFEHVGADADHDFPPSSSTGSQQRRCNGKNALPHVRMFCIEVERRGRRKGAVATSLSPSC